MNKIYLLFYPAACLFFSVSTFAADGQIKFTGDIVESGCVVTNNPTNPLTVTLGSVDKSAFGSPAVAGATAASTAFSLSVTGCTTSTLTDQVKVIFDAETDGDPSRIKLQQRAGSSASGVAIQIQDSNNAVMKIRQSDNPAYAVADGNNTYNFTARYIATSATIAAGPADATVDFTLSYQ